MDRRLAERLGAAFAHDRNTQRTDCAYDDGARAYEQPTEPTGTATQPAHGLDTIAEGDSASDSGEGDEAHAMSEESHVGVPPHAQDDPDTEVTAREVAVETVRPSEVSQASTGARRVLLRILRFF